MLFLAPKPNEETGLYPVLAAGGADHDKAWLRFPGQVSFAEAYYNDDDERMINGRRYFRSHSPSAGLDVYPYAGRGFGYVLYAALALQAADNGASGIFSPEGDESVRSEDASLMWKRLVKLGAASEVKLQSPFLLESKRTYQYMSLGHVLTSGWCLRTDDNASDDTPNRLATRWLRDDSDRRWIVKPHAIIRADLGPRAVPSGYENFVQIIRDRFPGPEGVQLAATFRNRDDVVAKLGPARAARKPRAKARAVAGLSGLRFGSAGVSDAEGLPALSAAERADAAAWSKVDF